MQYAQTNTPMIAETGTTECHKIVQNIAKARKNNVKLPKITPSSYPISSCS
jgi:hypothetical protein